jgi:hypothetical protein
MHPPPGEAATDKRKKQRWDRSTWWSKRTPPPLHLKMTGVFGPTNAATRAASQLVSLTHPCDWV